MLYTLVAFGIRIGPIDLFCIIKMIRPRKVDIEAFSWAKRWPLLSVGHYFLYMWSLQTGGAVKMHSVFRRNDYTLMISVFLDIIFLFKYLMFHVLLHIVCNHFMTINTFFFKLKS